MLEGNLGRSVVWPIALHLVFGALVWQSFERIQKRRRRRKDIELGEIDGGGAGDILGLRKQGRIRRALLAVTSGGGRMSGILGANLLIPSSLMFDPSNPHDPGV